MTRTFTIVEATYPKKFLLAIGLVAFLILAGFVIRRIHFSNDALPDPGIIILIIVVVVFTYKIFTTENFKRIGEIIFASDHLAVKDSKNNSVTYNYSEMTKVEFVYNGIFGDTISKRFLVYQGLTDTKDGSGNFLIFFYKGEKKYLNILLEEMMDVRALQMIFENMRTNYHHNLNLELDSTFRF